MNEFNIFINKLRTLNRGIEIRVGCQLYDDEAKERIFCEKDISELNLPGDCYLEGNHIINMSYELDIKVSPLNEMKLGVTYPPVDVHENKKISSVQELAVALIELNPGVQIGLDPHYQKTIVSPIPLKKVVFPKDYYYRNGFIEHRTYFGEGSIATNTFCSAKEYNLEKDAITLIDYDTDYELRHQADLDRMRGIGYEEKVEEKKSRPAIFEVIDERYEEMSNHIKAGIHNIADQHRSNPDRIKGRHFTIVAKEKELDQAASRRGRNAVMAGACIMAAAGAALLHDANIMVSVEQMLSSWEGFAQTFIDMGPISNVLTASASLFMARYFRRTREYHKIENQIQNLNDAYDESLIKGEDNDARSR